jgi:adenylate kinase
VEQAQFMEPHIEVLKVFHLSCPDRTELARRLRKRALKDNRFDDANETVIQNRFATYEAETKPILDYYAGDRIVDIDASQPPAKVLYDILAGIMTLDAWKELEKMKI